MRKLAVIAAIAAAATAAQARQFKPGDSFVNTNARGYSWKAKLGADGHICGEGTNNTWKDCGTYQIIGETICVQWEHTGNRCFNP